MKLKYHQLLKYIYTVEEISARELCLCMERKHNDHRDFYGLAALLQEGYIGFTGPNMDDIYTQACTFQCYSQPETKLQYREVTLLGKDEGTHSNLYVSSKSIEYFHHRSEMRKGWYIAAFLAFFASILSGVIVSKLTANEPVQNTERTITSCSSGTNNSWLVPLRFTF